MSDYLKMYEPLTGQPLEVVYTGFSSYRRVPVGLSLATMVTENVVVIWRKEGYGRLGDWQEKRAVY